MHKPLSKERLLAALLAIVMLAGLFPAGALAEDASPTPAFALTTEDGGASAVFLRQMKFVPLDRELKMPDAPDTPMEPPAGWENETDVARDAAGWLWFEYVMPDANAPQSGVTYSGIISAPLTFDGEDAPSADIYYNGAPVGTAWLAKTGTAGELKLSICFVTDEQGFFAPGARGYFWLNVRFDADQIANDGKQDIAIDLGGQRADTPQVDFTLTDPPVSASINKSCDSIDEAAQTIRWKTVTTVNAADLPSGEKTTTVTLNDFMPDQTYVDGTAVITAIDSVDCIADNYPITAAADPDDAHKICFTLSGLPLENDAHTIEFYYTTSFAGVDLGSKMDKKTGQAVFENTVTGALTKPNYTGKDDAGKPKIDEDTPTVDVPFDAEAKAEAPIQVARLEKTVSTTDLNGMEVTLVDGLLFWKIYVDSSLPGQYLIDTIGAGQYLMLDTDHPLTIGTYGDDKNYVAGSTTIYTTLSEDGISKTGVDSQYKISLGSRTGKTLVCYYTQIDGDVMELENDVAFHAAGIGEGVSTKKSFHLRDAFLDKVGTGYDRSTQKLGWKVTLSNGGFLTGQVKLEDTFDTRYAQRLLYGADDPFTLTVTTGSGSDVFTLNDQLQFLDDAGKEFGTLTLMHDGAPQTGFTVELNKAMVGTAYNSIVLCYKTQLCDADATNALGSWFNKTLNVQNDVTLVSTVSGKPSIHETTTQTCATPVLKKESDGGYDYATGTAGWKVTVNESQTAMARPTFTDTLTWDAGQAAWQYVEDSVRVQQGGVDVTERCTVAIDNGAASPTLTVTMPAAAAGNAPYLVTYRTRVDRTGLATNAAQTLKNSVALKRDPTESTAASANFFVTVDAGVLGKSGAKDADWNTNRVVNWTIDVNRNRADLTALAVNGKVTVYDTLEAGLLYLGATVTDADGAPADAAEITFDEASRQLAIAFPADALNGSCYQITLQTRVLDGKPHSNTVSFTAGTPGAGDPASGGSVATQYGSGYAMLPGTGAVLLHKQDSTGSPLAGAEFTVYKLAADGSEYALGVLTTSGAFETLAGAPEGSEAAAFSLNAGVIGLPYGSYRVVETKAPAGYENRQEEWAFTLAADAPIYCITCTNYQPAQLGTLVLTKTLTGSAPDKDKAEAALTFTVESAGDGGAAFRARYPLSLFDYNADDGVWTLTLADLPCSAYTITEEAADIDGFRLAAVTARVTVDGEEPTESEDGTAAVEIAHDRAVTAAYTNTYKKVLPAPTLVPAFTATPTPAPTSTPNAATPTPAPTKTPAAPKPTVTPTSTPRPTQTPTAAKAPAAVTAAPTAVTTPTPAPTATPAAEAAPAIPRTADDFPLGTVIFGMAASALAMAWCRKKRQR